MFTKGVPVYFKGLCGGCGTETRTIVLIPGLDEREFEVATQCDECGRTVGMPPQPCAVGGCTGRAVNAVDNVLVCEDHGGALPAAH